MSDPKADLALVAQPTEFLPAQRAEPAVIVRELPMVEGLRRLALRTQLAAQAPGESEEARIRRSQAEADVTDVARRSQAEIRRHVDAYLKEHFEGLAAQVTEVVLAHMVERLTKGFEASAERQMLTLSRMADDTRKQLRSFMRAMMRQPRKAAKRGKTSR